MLLLQGMDINDYLIDHRRFDWPTILVDWTWLLPGREFTLWLMNRFGDLFIVLDGGSVHLLQVCDGSIEKVAESRDDFCRMVDEVNNCNDWFMIPFIDKLVVAGKQLAEGRCYSFVLPPVMGGEYTVQNTCDLNVEEHFSVYASIHRQLRDVPDGTRVQLKVEA